MDKLAIALLAFRCNVYHCDEIFLYWVSWRLAKMRRALLGFGELRRWCRGESEAAWYFEVHRINCKAGRAARRESGSLDPRLSQAPNESWTCDFCAVNTNQRSKCSADFALSVLFEKHNFPFPYIFKAKVFGCSVWLCRKVNNHPATPLLPIFDSRSGENLQRASSLQLNFGTSLLLKFASSYYSYNIKVILEVGSQHFQE